MGQFDLVSLWLWCLACGGLFGVHIYILEVRGNCTPVEVRTGPWVTSVENAARPDAGATGWARNCEGVVFHPKSMQLKVDLNLFNFEQVGSVTLVTLCFCETARYLGNPVDSGVMLLVPWLGNFMQTKPFRCII